MFIRNGKTEEKTGWDPLVNPCSLCIAIQKTRNSQAVQGSSFNNPMKLEEGRKGRSKGYGHLGNTVKNPSSQVALESR